MNADTDALDALVDSFATDWLRLADPDIATSRVADPVMVLGPNGLTPVPRSTFLAAVTGRADAVHDAVSSVTTLTSATAQPLGDRMVLATITWTFGRGNATTALVSDFLLQREGEHTLRCVAYLPRTNVRDQLA